MIHPLPFARSYWVVPGKFLAGFYPGDLDPAQATAKLEALISAKVTTVINLMEVDEGNRSGQAFVTYDSQLSELATLRGRSCIMERHPIPDMSVTTVPSMTAILDRIDAAMLGDGCVYVHCWGGKGRTGTVVGCWLARHGHEDAGRKLLELTESARGLFGIVPQTTRQAAFIDEWRTGA